MDGKLIFSNQTSLSTPGSGYSSRQNRARLKKHKDIITAWHQSGCTVPEIIELLSKLSDGSCKPSPAQIYAELHRWGLRRYKGQKLDSARCLEVGIVGLKPKPVPCEQADIALYVERARTACRNVGSACYQTAWRGETPYLCIIQGSDLMNDLPTLLKAKATLFASIASLLHHGIRHLVLLTSIARLAISDMFMMETSDIENASEFGSSAMVHLQGLRRILNEWQLSPAELEHLQADHLFNAEDLCCLMSLLRCQLSLETSLSFGPLRRRPKSIERQYDKSFWGIVQDDLYLWLKLTNTKRAHRMPSGALRTGAECSDFVLQLRTKFLLRVKKPIRTTSALEQSGGIPSFNQEQRVLLRVKEPTRTTRSYMQGNRPNSAAFRPRVHGDTGRQKSLSVVQTTCHRSECNPQDRRQRPDSH